MYNPFYSKSGKTFSYKNVSHFRIFASSRAKIYVYFGIKTYFFLFYLLIFQNSPRWIFYILHYISLKYHFFNYFSFFIHNDYSLSSFILGTHKERIKKLNAKRIVSIQIYMITVAIQRQT